MTAKAPMWYWTRASPLGSLILAANVAAATTPPVSRFAMFGEGKYPPRETVFDSTVRFLRGLA